MGPGGAVAVRAPPGVRAAGGGRTRHVGPPPVGVGAPQRCGCGMDRIHFVLGAATLDRSSTGTGDRHRTIDRGAGPRSRRAVRYRQSVVARRAADATVMGSSAYAE